MRSPSPDPNVTGSAPSLPPLPPRLDAPHGSLAQAILGLPPGVPPSEVWRGAALMLLRASPREAESLAALFESPTAPDDVRRLVLDLLAGAGSIEAQATMRTLLASRTARKSARAFADLVQRLGLVEMPDAATLRFLAAVYIEARNQPDAVRAACAYALGACAGNARLAGDEDAAVRFTEAIRRDLLDLEDPSLRRALVLALGNAALTTDLRALVRAAQDHEASVRAAAAIALRRIDDVTARAQLLALLLDPEVRVAESAIHALSAQRLDDAEIERVAELVVRGETSSALDASLLQLLVAQRRAPTSSWGRAPVRRGARPGRLEEALRLLLARTSGVVSPSRAVSSLPPPAMTASGFVARPAATGSSPAIAAPPPVAFGAAPPSGRFASIAPHPSGPIGEDDVDAMDPTEAAPQTVRRPMSEQAKALLAHPAADGEATVVRAPLSPEEVARRARAAQRPSR